MNQSRLKNFWKSLSIGQKFSTVPIGFLIMITLLISFTLNSVSEGRLDTFFNEVVARQRMLNQMHMKALLLSQTTIKADISYVRDVFNTTGRAMLDGGEVLVRMGHDEKRRIEGSRDPEVRALLSRSLEMMDQFSLEADSFLATNTSDPSYLLKLSDLNKRNIELHEVLTDLVKELTKDSEARLATFIFEEIGLSIAACLFGLLLSMMLVKHMVGPLTNMVALANGIAAGDLRQAKLVINAEDEIGRLGKVFNSMYDNLIDLAKQNISVSKNLGASASEVLAAIQEQAAAVKEQAASVQQTTATMEEIGQSGAQIAERAKQVASIAEATSSSGARGLEAVQNSSRTMMDLRDKVEAVAEKIVALSAKTQEISVIIATVTDLAEQSNLLALNAAIEAAAAGEHGRSFSVVANEIKNLADQAKESTVQVRSILGDIQGGINSSVMLTEQAVKGVESGKAQAEVAEKTIYALADSTKESIRAFQQIVGATNQQQIGFEQITNALRIIHEGAEQTATGTAQLEKAAVGLNQLGQKLQTSIERYRI